MRKVVLSPQAEADLDAIAMWIAEQGSPLTALSYIQRVRQHLAGYADFPEHGIIRDDIRPGLRIVGFERRLVIAFAVFDTTVEIERIFYAGRNWEQWPDHDRD